MFTWKAYYYFDGLPLTIYSSEDMEWSDLPKVGVVYVDIVNGNFSQRMQGMDNYWIDGFKYGMFINTGELGQIELQRRIAENRKVPEYTGMESVTYMWENEHIFLGDVKQDVNPSLIKEGILIPDEIAEQLGLI